MQDTRGILDAALEACLDTTESFAIEITEDPIAEKGVNNLSIVPQCPPLTREFDTTLVTFFTRISHFSEVTLEGYINVDSKSYTEEARVVRLLQHTNCKHLVIMFYSVQDLATHEYDNALRVLHDAVLKCGATWITYRARATKRNEDALWTWYLSRLFPSRDPGIKVDYDFLHEGEDLIRFILQQLVV